MKTSDHIRCSIDDFESGDKFESSLLHACNAIDGTARKLFINEKKSNKERFIDCLKKYYWLIEPMALSCIDLDRTKWTMVKLKNNNSPSFAEIIYEVFRCNQAHGEEHPKNYSLLKCVGTGATQIGIADGEINFPDNLVFALLSVAILSKVNVDQKIQDGYYFSLGEEKFMMNDWWGREDDFRIIAAKYSKPKIEIVW